MSDNPKSREHIHPVMLNAAYYISIAKLMGELEIGKSAAIELALAHGLRSLGVLSQEDFELFDARYRRPLKEIIEENKRQRETSHIPKLELEKQKREQIVKWQNEQPIQKQAAKENELNKIFSEQLAIWDERQSPEFLTWRVKTLANAQRHSNLEYAKLLIVKANASDTLPQSTEPYDATTSEEAAT